MGKSPSLGCHDMAVGSCHGFYVESDSMTSRDERIKEQVGKEELFKEDFQKLMGSPSGRRIVFWLLATSGVMQTTLLEVKGREHYMALAMAHAEGKKDMGYRLMDKISKICPEKYTVMMKENSNG